MVELLAERVGVDVCVAAACIVAPWTWGMRVGVGVGEHGETRGPQAGCTCLGREKLASGAGPRLIGFEHGRQGFIARRFTACVSGAR